MEMKEIIRHFFRCFDCLSVFATEGVHYDTDADFPTCPCGGEVNYMGPVTKQPVYQTDTLSACDGRCTEAKGNSCDCVCGGVNHGSGKVVDVHTRIDIEAPKVKGIDYDYAEAVRKRRADIKAPFAQEIDQIERGEFVHDKTRWWAANRLRDILHEAKWAFTKTKRENVFRKADEIMNRVSI